MSSVGLTAVGGDRTGHVRFLRLENVTPGPPLLTEWLAPGDSAPAFGCLHCRVWSEVPSSALGTELPCPHCGNVVKLNPFVIETDWRPIAAAWRGEPEGVWRQLFFPSVLHHDRMLPSIRRVRRPDERC